VKTKKYDLEVPVLEKEHWWAALQNICKKMKPSYKLNTVK